MYGKGQVLMSAANASMGVASENVMSSSDHHHHLHHHQFFMSSPVRNPNNFNFMSAASALPSFHPFPTLIPKEEGVGYMGLRKEDMDSLSGGEQLELEVGGGMTSANELDIISNRHLSDQDAAFQPGVAGGSKKKRYHRHTAHQIQEMEALFKECPHPDDKQRLKLSQELGLKPRQVKFWFQNRRTQMKAQQDRSDNAILRTENDGLKTENYRLQALMRSLMCPTCGGASLLGEVAYDEQQLRLENARLKDELDRLCNIASRYSGRSFQSMGPPHVSPPPPGLLPPSLDLDMSIYSRHFQEPSAIPPSCSDHGMVPLPFLPLPDHHPGPHHNQPFQGGILLLDEERSLAMDLALSSLDELVKMCQTDEPLWIRNLSHNNVSIEVLELEEHSRMFPWAMSAKQHYNVECSRTEATRHSTLVIMNSLNLVDAFLDDNKWIDLFPSIVSRAKTLQIVASGASGHPSGSLHLMYAELQVLSPLVPTRETFFLRYFHHNAEAGIWSIVDFPIDNFQCASALQPSLPRYRRRPSGCIIQDMPNGYSKVTWVEHAEVLEEKPVHQIFNQYVNNSMAFGAHRWLAILQRQCERVASQMARNISNVGEVIQSPEARKNLMRLSQRMISMFCTNISTAGGQSWTAVSDSVEDTVRITTRKVTEPGQPNGVILGAVSTTWLPYPHDQVFNLLKNEHKRSQLEALFNGYSLQEIAHIANGSDPGNCISLLRTNVASNSSQNVDLMLQESCTDSSGSLIVYATVEVNYIQLVMSGEDPSCIPLLPLGFSIIPFSMNDPPQDTPSNEGGPQGEGCLITVGLQVLASTIPTTKLCLSSVKAINSHLCNAVSQINAALSSNTSISNNADPPSSPTDAKPTPPKQ